MKLKDVSTVPKHNQCETRLHPSKETKIFILRGHSAGKGIQTQPQTQNEPAMFPCYKEG